MSELARRAQDRLTMGTVVAETQATLRDIEQRLDRFFRNPLERADLPAHDCDVRSSVRRAVIARL